MTTTEAETKTTNEKLQELLNDLADTAGALYGRWLDEWEYEDINDYAVAFAPIVERHNGQIVKMTKLPFGFKFTLEEKMFQFKVNSKTIAIKPV